MTVTTVGNISQLPIEIKSHIISYLDLSLEYIFNKMPVIARVSKEWKAVADYYREEFGPQMMASKRIVSALDLENPKIDGSHSGRLFFYMPWGSFERSSFTLTLTKRIEELIPPNKDALYHFYIALRENKSLFDYAVKLGMSKKYLDHLAEESGHKDWLSMIVSNIKEWGNPDAILDVKGRTALDLAIENGNEAIVKNLLDLDAMPSFSNLWEMPRLILKNTSKSTMLSRIWFKPIVQDTVLFPCLMIGISLLIMVPLIVLDKWLET